MDRRGFFGMIAGAVATAALPRKADAIEPDPMVLAELDPEPVFIGGRYNPDGGSYPQGQAAVRWLRYESMPLSEARQRGLRIHRVLPIR